MSKIYPPKPKIIVILGPTASGKSELGVRLAKKFSARGGSAFGGNGAEIISADSRQVYRGMDIGTGKVPRDKNPRFQILDSRFLHKGIPHHLIDVASPKRTFTVAQYQKLGKAAIKKILSRGKLPIIVGGTGFYIDALLHDYHLPRVKANPALRRELERKSAEELFHKLKAADPRRARTIDRWNKRRLVRALEIILTTGRPIPPPPRKIYSSILKNTRIDKNGILKIGIKMDPMELKRKIHKRLLSRMRQGMIGEVKRLRRLGISWKKLDSFGLEYRFISRYLRKLKEGPSPNAPSAQLRINQGAREAARAEMLASLETAIWRYAKRQVTWFKRDKEIHWVTSKNAAEKLVKKFLKKLIGLKK